MSKGSRSGDKFFHDIPYYPGSSTPDGRIVGEVNKSRHQDAEYHKKSLEIQQSALKEITRLHGGQITVRRSDFNEDDTKEVFLRTAQEMCRSHENAGEETYERLEGIDRSIKEGFDRSHEDIEDLKGPAFPKLHVKKLVANKQDLMEILSAFRHGALNEDGKMQLRGLIGIHLKQYSEAAEGILSKLNKAIAESKEKPEGLPDAKELRIAWNTLKYPNGILNDPEDAAARIKVLYEYANKYNQPELLAFVSTVANLLHDLQGSDEVPVSSNMIVRLANNGLLNDAAKHAAMERLPDARRDPSIASLNYHLADLVRDSGQSLAYQRTMVSQHDAMINLDMNRNNLLSTMVNIGHGTNLRLDRIIDQGDQQLEQGDTMISQGDTQIAQTDVLIDQGHEQLRQGHTMNYNLGLVVNNLAGVQGEIINLEELTKHFILLFHGHMGRLGKQIHEDLGQIDRTLHGGFEKLRVESTITRLAIVSGFAHLGDVISEQGAELRDTLEREGKCTRMEIHDTGRMVRQTIVDIGIYSTGRITGVLEKIDADVRGGNNLIRQLIEIELNSLSNEERQHCEDGTQCLKNAETEGDLEDAYDAFKEGTEKIRNSAINHFGAAIASEMLGKTARAAEHFRKAARRAKENQRDLASKALTARAKIKFGEGDVETSRKDSEEAVEKDASNSEAYHQLAQCYAFSKRHDEAAMTLAKLIGMDESYYVAYETNPLFATIPVELKKKLLEHIWKENFIKSREQEALLLRSMLAAGAKKAAIEVSMDMLQFSPEQLMRDRIWAHPDFNTLKDLLLLRLVTYANKNGSKLIARHGYELLAFMYHCGAGEDALFPVFEMAMEKDPALFNDDQKTRIQLINASIKNVAGADADSLWQKLKKGSNVKYLWLFS